MAGPVLPLLAARPAAVRGGTLVLLLLALLLLVWVLRRIPRRGADGDEAPQPFLAHVETLRRTLLVSFGAFVAATCFAFGFRLEPRWGVWVPVPAVADNLAAQLYRRLAADLIPPQVRLVATGPLDGFMAEFTVALGLGFALALPVILAQAVRFLGPALRPAERRALAAYVLPALLLFLAGAAFCYLLVLPFLFGTLYAYSDALGAELLLHVGDFVTFSFGLVLVFGAAFQTPLVMVALTRVGLVPAKTWRRTWRHAVVAIFVLAALVTDPTVFSQLMVALPLTGLYFVGLGIAQVVERRAARAAA